MEQTIKLSIHTLKVHPRNQEFFDDIEGETYEQFRESIKSDGIITPIIVAPDMTVISGHQRLKACQDLGIDLIPAIIREELIDEDVKLRQLIASNFGRLKNDPAKMRKAVAEYVELVGFKKGDNQWVGQDVLPKLSQDQIAKELGITERELRRLLKIERNLIPELRQAMDKSFISKTAALGICSKLDEQEQEELLLELNKVIADKSENTTNEKVSVSNKEVDILTEQINHLKETNQKLIEKNTELLTVETEKYNLEEEIEVLKEKMKNIKPVDRPETLAKIQRLEERETLLKEKIEIIEQDVGKYKQLKEQISNLTKEKDDISRQIVSATSLSDYVVDIEHLLKNNLAPIKYSRALMDMQDNPTVIKNLKNIVESVEVWCFEIRKYLPQEYNNTIIIESEEI